MWECFKANLTNHYMCNLNYYVQTKFSTTRAHYFRDENNHNNSHDSKVLHHSPVGILQLASLLESDNAGQGLQDLPQGLQVHRQLLQKQKRPSQDWKHTNCSFTWFHPHTQSQTYLLGNELDQELTELQGFHHLFLHHFALSWSNQLKTLGEEVQEIVYLELTLINGLY